MRLTLLAIWLGALALAGCGGDNRALIPQDQADRLAALVDEAGSASASGECDAARRAVREAQAELNELPRRTDGKLKQNLADWLEHLDTEIEGSCGQEEEADETPTATDTPTPTATPEPTETPVPTATPEPGTGGEPAPEQPDGTDGVDPGQDG